MAATAKTRLLRQGIKTHIEKVMGGRFDAIFQFDHDVQVAIDAGFVQKGQQVLLIALDTQAPLLRGGDLSRALTQVRFLLHVIITLTGKSQYEEKLLLADDLADDLADQLERKNFDMALYGGKRVAVSAVVAIDDLDFDIIGRTLGLTIDK